MTNATIKLGYPIKIILGSSNFPVLSPNILGFGIYWF